MATDLVLYGYWRSSAAFRVRIALNLKGLAYENRFIHLVRDGGEQHAPAYVELNPQALVPTLVDHGTVLTQSLAIIEYLEERFPQTPLLPADAAARARVRGLAQQIACDVHPLGNLRVLQQLGREFSVDDAQKAAWMQHWIALGFQALETSLAASSETAEFCHGNTPGMADACLVPQVYNAVRWKVPLDDYPTIARINASCLALSAFQRATPEKQPDAVAPTS